MNVLDDLLKYVKDEADKVETYTFRCDEALYASGQWDTFELIRKRIEEMLKRSP